VSQAAGWVTGAGGHGWLVVVQTWASHIDSDPSMSAVDSRELDRKKTSSPVSLASSNTDSSLDSPFEINATQPAAAGT
jgi:hypothetical protein